MMVPPYMFCHFVAHTASWFTFREGSTCTYLCANGFIAQLLIKCLHLSASPQSASILYLLKVDILMSMGLLCLLPFEA